MYLRALEFSISLKRAASPKFGKTAQGILSVKECSKAKLCGKKHAFAVKCSPLQRENRNLLFIISGTANRVKFLCFLIYPDTWKKKWLNVAKRENE